VESLVTNVKNGIVFLDILPLKMIIDYVTNSLSPAHFADFDSEQW
jgi:hypothetical protein